MTPIMMATSGVLATILVAATLAVWRLVRGPTLADRVVALDLLAIYVVGAMVTAAIHYESPVLLQPAVTLTLLGFLGTVAFAQYTLKRLDR